LSSVGQTYTHRLEVSSLANSVRWMFFDGISRLGPGYTIPSPLAWSSDNRYLFVTNRPTPDGCSYLANGSDLFRLDLQSGEIVTITAPIGNVLSVSTDGQLLAYVGYGDKGLVIRDIGNGHETPIQLPPFEENSEVGSIVFSPNNSQLALTALSGFCGPTGTKSVTLLTADLQTFKVTHQLSQTNRTLLTVGWLDSERVILHDESGASWVWAPKDKIIGRYEK